MASSNSTSHVSVVYNYETPCFHLDTDLIRALRVAPLAPIAFFAITGNPPTSSSQTWRLAISTVVYIPRVITIILFEYKWLVHGSAGLILCHLLPFLIEITIIVSVLTIVPISVERFLAVTFPLRTFFSTKICVFVIFAMWLIAISVKIPTIFATDLDEFQGKTYCIVPWVPEVFSRGPMMGNCIVDFDLTYGAGSGQIYFKIVFIVLYAILFSVTVLLNSAIAVTMRNRRVPGDSFSEACNMHREETNRRIMRMFFVVVLAFLLCWSLYFILMVLRKNGVYVPCDVLYLRLLLVHFNAALKPWLYAMFSENYRQEFGDIVSKIGCPIFVTRQREPVRDNPTTSRGQNSVEDNVQITIQLQTLGTPQYNSTLLQLLD